MSAHAGSASLSGSGRATTFKEGDKVLVTEGDLKNLDGTIVSVTDEGKLMVKASMAELAGNAPLTIEAQHVVKFFQVRPCSEPKCI